MNSIETLSQDERVTVRRKGAPDPEGNCVVYWMQRAQRAQIILLWMWPFTSPTN